MSTAPVLSNQHSTIEAYSPSELNTLLGKLTEHVIRQQYEQWQLGVVVRGRIGRWQDRGYSTIFGIPLADAKETVLLDLPRELLTAEITPGDEITARGILTTKIGRYTANRLEFRLSVSAIARSNSVDEAPMEKEAKAFFTRLQQWGPQRRPWPTGAVLRIAIIHSASSTTRVVEDFLDEIRPLGPRVRIAKIPVDIRDPRAIANAISGASCDILAVIRGGGEQMEFLAFDDEEVIASMVAHPAYRVLGLGHSDNTTLLDWVVDYAATTPTAAASHLRKRLEVSTGVADAPTWQKWIWWWLSGVVVGLLLGRILVSIG
jgi:exonuclease VII large subunit